MELLHKHKFLLHQLVIGAFIVSLPLNGQEIKVKVTDMDKSGELLQDLSKELEELQVEMGDLNISFENSGNVKLGLYLEDLDFEDAYEKHYPYCYGVLVSGLTSSGNGKRAGLIKGDIIMEFDGEKVLFEDHLISLRDSKNIGDSVELTIFRNEKVLSKTLTFAPPVPDLDKNGKVIKSKNRKSVGYGGGGPMALLIDYNLGLNEILEANDFKGVTAPIVLYGGYGMGNVGNGIFVGGGGVGTQIIQQMPYTNSDTGVQGYKRYQIDFGFGGATLVKKFPLFSEKILMDFGLLLGGGSIKLNIAATDGKYAWNSVVQDLNSNVLQIEKNFLVYRPSAGVMVRINNWLGVSASAGYLGTYSPDSKWKESNFDFTVVGDSPKSIGNVSYTVGLWFGH